jgi:hypothetical protein
VKWYTAVWSLLFTYLCARGFMAYMGNDPVSTKNVAGVNADESKAPRQWHAEFKNPQPVPPLPRMVNNSMMAAAQAWQEQQERDALFTMEVARKNLRNAALFTLM